MTTEQEMKEAFEHGKRIPEEIKFINGQYRLKSGTYDGDYLYYCDKCAEKLNRDWLVWYKAWQHHQAEIDRLLDWQSKAKVVYPNVDRLIRLRDIALAKAGEKQ